MLSQIVIRKYPYRDGWAGGTGPAISPPPRRHSMSLCSRIILLCPRAAKTAEWQLDKALEVFNLLQDASHATGLDKFDHVS
jgi:hypothetical protein